jgi:hypothetical protein
MALNLMVVFVGAWPAMGFWHRREAFAASGFSRADAFRATLGSLLVLQAGG